MSAEKLYEHLSYLNDAINSLEGLLAHKSAEINDLNLKLANAEMTILATRKDSEDFANRISQDARKHIESEVHSRVEATISAERLAMKEELERSRKQLADAKINQSKKSTDPQIDLFGQTWGAPSAAHKIANDQSALILAGRLDSTIDKVQRLLREAGA
ncbi:MAG TPA: hypothetical protein PLE43_05940 [Alphaproteobacteria bacterium]|jgi:chromosome segregation ATPase|nr:hypothetical protein [Alphaproteobacteria bacterium]MCB9984668.1 hypothetical protein [Micavibrio sp.]HPQ50359.1 hypothetical protein [Alphaproteobacteria bacterium]HRK98000.1 hypothetical protein [Alphaproteobacteria bacterium]